MNTDRKAREKSKPSPGRLRRLLEWIARGGHPKNLSGC